MDKQKVRAAVGKYVIFFATLNFIPLVGLSSDEWCGGGDVAEATAAFVVYTNDTAQVVSVSGDGQNWAAALPFVIPVNGDVTSFSAALVMGEGALPAPVRDSIAEAHARGPYRQWLLRRTLAESIVPITNNVSKRTKAIEAAYFSNKAQGAVFTNVNVEVLKRIAATVKPMTLPPIACVWPIFEEYARGPIRRAIPGHDYPGVLPEEMVSTPLGIAITLRAPERWRRFRFRATANASGRAVEYRWQPLRRGATVSGWSGGRGMTPTAGFAEITVDWSALASRIDIIVCARVVGGMWGPPAVISFSRPAGEIRSWNRRGEIERIRYPEWTDVYDLDGKGSVIGFLRKRVESFENERFAFADELVLETWPNGSPRRVLQVTYRQLKAGILKYTHGTEVKTYSQGRTNTRERGEFIVNYPRDERATHGKPMGSH